MRSLNRVPDLGGSVCASPSLLIIAASLVHADPIQEISFSAEQRAYWVFQPVEHPKPPSISDPAWIRTPVDAFVLAKLSQERLVPSPQASRVTLIRRAFFDLIGLPPTPAQVSTFVADTFPGAYERLIDHLLASAPLRGALGAPLA